MQILFPDVMQILIYLSSDFIPCAHKTNSHTSHHVPLSFMSGSVQPLSKGLFKQTTGSGLLKRPALFLDWRKLSGGETISKRTEKGHKQGRLNLNVFKTQQRWLNCVGVWWDSMKIEAHSKARQMDKGKVCTKSCKHSWASLVKWSMLSFLFFLTETHKRRKSLRRRFDSFSKEKKERGQFVTQTHTRQACLSIKQLLPTGCLPLCPFKQHDCPLQPPLLLQ